MSAPAVALDSAPAPTHQAAPRPRHSHGPLTGTARMLRTSLRHDARQLAPWIVLVTVLSASSVIVYPIVFPEVSDRMGLAAAIGSNPALGLIFGPANDLSTTDGFNAWRSLALGGFLAGLGAIFAVTRATRAQEDSGQAELLASGVMGRSARLASAVLVSMIGSVLVGALSGLVTVAFGGGWEASMLLGAGFTVTGWMFAAVAAVTAQIGSDARTANSLAVGTLGTLFLLRGFCFSIDAPMWTIWANPLGWIQQTEPALSNDWMPLLMGLAFMAVVIAAAFVLQSRRDFGQGMIAPKPGPARGHTRSSLGLALRLNAGSFATWLVAAVALGVVFGYFSTSVTDMLGADSAAQQILASGATSPAELTGTFMVTILTLIGIFASIPGVQVMVKLRHEEIADRVEPVLAAPLARSRYFAANIFAAFAISTVFVVIAGVLVAALAAGADIGVGFGEVVGQAVAVIPAVWTIVAVAVAVIGARPAVTIASWVGVLISFGLTLLGPTFGLDDWVLAISPLWHVPHTMLANPDWSGLGWVSLVTVLLIAVGLAGFRRRDLAR